MDQTLAALYGAIGRDPNAVAPYAVLADYLEEQGDPTAPLIQVGCQLLTEGPSDALVRSHIELEDGLADQLWGDLAPLTEDDDVICNIEWHCGFVKSVKLRNNGFSHQTDYLDDVLEQLLSRPVMRFNRTLRLGVMHRLHTTYESACAILGRHELSNLKTLVIGDFHMDETELNWAFAGDVSKAFPACTNLEHLMIRSGTMTLGKIVLPELRSFRTQTGGFTEANLQEVLKADWPNLEQLVLEFGHPIEGALAEVEPLGPILQGTNLDKVTHLGLTSFLQTDVLCEALDGAPILRQLKVLSLQKGTLTDRGCKALANIRDQLAHLELLELGSQNTDGTEDGRLTDGGIAMVSDLCERVVPPSADGFHPAFE